LKICVYAICKNEAQFARRWARSMGEADWVVALDTGSADETVEILKEEGVQVACEKIVPWRFDVARNRSLQLIPRQADICVCTDLDEVFRPGWRSALEACWTKETTQAKYRYTWNFLPDGREGVVFWAEKIHKNGCFCWENPVHEVLKYTGPAPQHVIACAGAQLDHHADSSKSRAQYLPLLELAVRESPQNDRNVHYLGREYMFYGKWQSCIDTLKRHLSMPSAVWKDERCASMRYIARAYAEMGDATRAFSWILRAVAEAPHLREPYVDAALQCYRLENWHGVLFMILQALDITQRPDSYITEAQAWGSLPEDIASIAYYHIGNREMAAQMCARALEKSPEDERLKNNLKLFENM